jgi:hypothetical protein
LSDGCGCRIGKSWLQDFHVQLSTRTDDDDDDDDDVVMIQWCGERHTWEIVNSMIVTINCEWNHLTKNLAKLSFFAKLESI